MSIFRTIKKIRDCDICHGSGIDPDSKGQCGGCEGTGKVEIYSRVSQSAAQHAKSAIKTQLPPHERVAARERLEDHEPAKDEQGLPTKGKQSKVGKGFIDEE